MDFYYSLPEIAKVKHALQLLFDALVIASPIFSIVTKRNIYFGWAYSR